MLNLNIPDTQRIRSQNQNHYIVVVNYQVKLLGTLLLKGKMVKMQSKNLKMKTMITNKFIQKERKNLKLKVHQESVKANSTLQTILFHQYNQVQLSAPQSDKERYRVISQETFIQKNII